MANAKFIVIYPRPKDIEAFEQVYQKEHVPMAVAKQTLAHAVSISSGGAPIFLVAEEETFSSTKTRELRLGDSDTQLTLATVHGTRSTPTLGSALRQHFSTRLCVQFIMPFSPRHSKSRRAANRIRTSGSPE